MAEKTHMLDSRGDAVGYADDYAAWVEHQVRLLRARRVSELDFDNLIDEVESLSSSVFREFVSALRLILLHMLKWDHQPARRTRSWQSSIEINQKNVSDLLKENPSFRSRIEGALDKAYFTARREAAGETDLPRGTFPDTCPYDWATITTREHRLPGDED